MVLLSPYTFGLSLAFTPAAATVGAIAGGIGGGATGLTAGIIADNISNAEITKMKGEISVFLEDYKKMMEQISRDCQNETQKEHYDNETKDRKSEREQLSGLSIPDATPPRQEAAIMTYSEIFFKPQKSSFAAGESNN
ncbi:7919_t:CDS:2 [Racocetra persica]|uniref:7919_t:CDS:1 n=1 Tax=Racocetra persica TaxID=160502 RepID=A0ACA9RLV3_9GLOM|nr:7919_t:CDS:2 [Racocetra persica]